VRRSTIVWPTTSKYPTHGRNQVVRDRVGDDAATRRGFFRQTIARTHEHAARADGVRELDIEPPIADDERARRIDVELLDSAVDQAARRLAAFAADGVLLDLPVRMVRTIVI